MHNLNNKNKLNTKNQAIYKNLLSYALLCLIAFFAIHLHITKYSFIDWADSYDYHGVSKSFITDGTLLSYTFYDSIENMDDPKFEKRVYNLPNYGFQLTLVGLALLRGEFDFLNGVITSCIFTLLLTFLAYFTALHLCKRRDISIIFAVLLIFHPSVFDITARALSDLGLLFFFGLSVFSCMRDKPFIAGFVLGIGYFYREHALMFLPFIPLLCPSCTSIKSYIRSMLLTVAGFSIFFIARYLVKQNYAYTSAEFYLKHYTNWSKLWLSLESQINFLINIKSYAVAFGAHICAFIVACMVFWRKVPPSVLKYIFVGICISLIPCKMWSANPSVPIRYQVYSILLFYIAALMLIVKIKENRMQLFTTLTASIVALSLGFAPILNSKIFEQAMAPQKVYDNLFQTVRIPFTMQTELPSNSVIMSNHLPSTHIAFHSPEVVLLPNYEQFLNGKHNHKIHAIMIKSDGFKTWELTDILQDNLGVRFKLHETLKITDNLKLHLYLRESK